MKIQQINSKISNHTNKNQSVSFQKAIKLPHNKQVQKFISEFSGNKGFELAISAGREANINFHSNQVFDLAKTKLKELNLWDNAIVWNKDKVTKEEFKTYYNAVVF